MFWRPCWRASVSPIGVKSATWIVWCLDIFTMSSFAILDKVCEFFELDEEIYRFRQYSGFSCYPSFLSFLSTSLFFCFCTISCIKIFFYDGFAKEFPIVKEVFLHISGDNYVFLTRNALSVIEKRCSAFEFAGKANLELWLIMKKNMFSSLGTPSALSRNAA